MNILVVRLGALGDIVHAVPAVAALRAAFPDARIDWFVDAKHAPFLELVESIDRVDPARAGVPLRLGGRDAAAAAGTL